MDCRRHTGAKEFHPLILRETRTMIRFGKTIRRLRNAKGLKQRELAARLPVTPTYLSHLENDRVEPSIKLLRGIARVLNTPVEVIFWDSVDLPDNASPDDRKACELAKLVVRHWHESHQAARRRPQRTSRKATRP